VSLRIAVCSIVAQHHRSRRTNMRPHLLPPRCCCCAVSAAHSSPPCSAFQPSLRTLLPCCADTVPSLHTTPSLPRIGTLAACAIALCSHRATSLSCAIFHIAAVAAVLSTAFLPPSLRTRLHMLSLLNIHHSIALDRRPPSHLSHTAALIVLAPLHKPIQQPRHEIEPPASHRSPSSHPKPSITRTPNAPISYRVSTPPAHFTPTPPRMATLSTTAHVGAIIIHKSTGLAIDHLRRRTHVSILEN